MYMFLCKSIVLPPPSKKVSLSIWGLSLFYSTLLFPPICSLEHKSQELLHKKKNGFLRQINLGNVVYFSLLEIDNTLWYIESFEKSLSKKTWFLLCLSHHFADLYAHDRPFLFCYNPWTSGMVWEGKFYTTDSHQHLDFTLKKSDPGLGQKGKLIYRNKEIVKGKWFLGPKPDSDFSEKDQSIPWS